MEIKTGNEIYLLGLDVIEANKRSRYNDLTTKTRTKFNDKKWFSADDIQETIKKLSSICCNNHHQTVVTKDLLKELGLELMKSEEVNDD